MRPLAGIAVAALLGGCATAPLSPDPAVDLKGRWTVVAVNGEVTPGGRRFNFEVNPAYGSAQFGCNTGSGRYSLTNGWFYPSDWIITAADCPNRDNWLHFESRGFEILAKPLAIERRPAGVRLRNEVGSIDLVPAPPVTVSEIVGSWDVVEINGVATPAGPNFRVTITPRELDARFGCNRYNAEYRLEDGRLRPVMARYTEMSCELVGPDGPKVPVMTLEKWGFRILGSGPELVLRPGNRMALVTSEGAIELNRRLERR